MEIAQSGVQSETVFEIVKQFAALFIAFFRNVLLYKAITEDNLLFTVFHHLNIHASYNFRLPGCKPGWFTNAAKKISKTSENDK